MHIFKNWNYNSNSDDVIKIAALYLILNKFLFYVSNYSRTLMVMFIILHKMATILITLQKWKPCF